MPQTPRDKLLAIKRREEHEAKSANKWNNKVDSIYWKTLLKSDHDKYGKFTTNGKVHASDLEIIQEIINQNDLAKKERRRQLKNEWQRNNSYYKKVSFRGKHDDGQGSYRNKDGDIIGYTNPLWSDYLIKPKEDWRKGSWSETYRQLYPKKRYD